MIIQFFSLFFILILIALSLISIPFLFEKKFYFKEFFIISCIGIMSSIFIYYLIGDYTGLHLWLTQGAKHYQIQQEVARLGGIDTIIKRIEMKLKENPDDPKGWMILGKLYLSKHEQEKAVAAFNHIKK